MQQKILHKKCKRQQRNSCCGSCGFVIHPKVKSQTCTYCCELTNKALKHPGCLICCPDCDNRVCKNGCDFLFDNCRCTMCGYFACNECQKLHKCSQCDRYMICDKCCDLCNYCNEVICHFCQKTCNLCGKIICTEKKCSIKKVCGLCARIRFCNSCFDISLNLCVVCRDYITPKQKIRRFNNVANKIAQKAKKRQKKAN